MNILAKRKMEGSIHSIHSFSVVALNETTQGGLVRTAENSFVGSMVRGDNESFIFDRNDTIKTNSMEFRNELFSSDVVNLYGGSPTELLYH